MAASSQCSSLAPIDFDVSTSFEDAMGPISVAVERCPLCSMSIKPLYCKQCLEKGDFTHSKRQQSIRYSEKVQKWESLKEKLKNLQTRGNTFTKKIEEAAKKLEIDMTVQRVNILKKEIHTMQETISKEKNALQSLKRDNIVRKSQRKQYAEKMQRIQEYIAQRDQAISITNEKNMLCEEELCITRKEHVEKLFQYIFPITEVLPKSDPETMAVSTVSALAEARHTAFVRGRWVYMDNGGELKYKIIEPCLPGNGDYAAYSLWIAANKESTHESNQHNPAYTYSAALGYTAQVLIILAHLLHVNLPKHLCYGEFCSSELDEKHFNSLVNRLNYNVLHLCCSQRVDPNCLSFKHTLHNLLMLQKAPYMGRSGSFLVNPVLVLSMEENGYSDDSSNEDETDFVFDWESIPPGLPEVSEDVWSPNSHSSGTLSRTSQISAIGTSPPGGGIMASAATSFVSFWRVATGTGKK